MAGEGRSTQKGIHSDRRHLPDTTGVPQVRTTEAASERVPVESRIFEDEAHGISRLENRVEAYCAVVDFLDEHVR